MGQGALWRQRRAGSQRLCDQCHESGGLSSVLRSHYWWQVPLSWRRVAVQDEHDLLPVETAHAAMQAKYRPCPQCGSSDLALLLMTGIVLVCLTCDFVKRYA